MYILTLPEVTSRVAEVPIKRTVKANTLRFFMLSRARR